MPLALLKMDMISLLSAAGQPGVFWLRAFQKIPMFAFA